MPRISEAARWGPDGGQRLGSSQSQSNPVRSRQQLPRHGRIIGNVWHKSVTRSLHQLQKPPAWAVDLAELEAAEDRGVQWVELREQEKGLVYRAPLAAFRASGFEFDRGHGQHVALPLSLWQVTGPREPAARQLALFPEVA